MTDYTAILPVGKENAISGAELMQKVGFTDIRSLQQDIAKSRENGQIILSSTQGGYFLPANDSEIEEFVKALQNRALNTLKTLKYARRTLKAAKVKKAGQLSIDDVQNGSSTKGGKE